MMGLGRMVDSQDARVVDYGCKRLNLLNILKPILALEASLPDRYCQRLQRTLNQRILIDGE